MKATHETAHEPVVQAALAELKTLIRQQYPEAHFRVGQGEDDPPIIQLVTTVDVDDTEPVLDLVVDRLLDLQAEGLPIFVVTERPIARTLALVNAGRAVRQVTT